MYLELILILEVRRALTIVTLIQLIKHCTRLHNTTFVNFRTWQKTTYAEQTANSLAGTHRIPAGNMLPSSVADPGCLSRILIFTHPGSRISDPKTATKERGEQNFLSNIFCSHKFHKM
jgi:hypothetical protein